MKHLFRFAAAVFHFGLRAMRSLWSLLGPAPGWSGLQRWMLQIATLGVIVAVAGFLFSLSGLAPIKASSGHWPITEWFLSFSMSRAVSTQSLGIVVPDLDDPDLVLKGATHFETGCFPCHGSPIMKQPRIARAMTPHPPYLAPEVGKWDPEELFYIVKHGVKFTGMPAWPTQHRDDEVWAMVAFLKKFPELDAQRYRQLVSGDGVMNKEDAPLQALTGPDATPRVVTDSCQRCHGADGLGRGTGAFPILTGQNAAYFEASLEAYARGDRHSGIMEPIAAGLSRAEMKEVARFYARLVAPEQTPSSPTSGSAIARGAALAREGLPSRRIPICAECHGPGDTMRNPNYPSLAGQHAKYLVLQLELFANGHRGGTPYAHLMHPVADRLSPQQMRDVALYYASLPLPCH